LTYGAVVRMTATYVDSWGICRVAAGQLPDPAHQITIISIITTTSASPRPHCFRPSWYHLQSCTSLKQFHQTELHIFSNLSAVTMWTILLCNSDKCSAITLSWHDNVIAEHCTIIKKTEQHCTVFDTELLEIQIKHSRFHRLHCVLKGTWHMVSHELGGEHKWDKSHKYHQ